MSNTFEIKVVNSLNDIMFVANVSYIYTNAFSPKVRSYIANIIKVEPGLGNCGDSMEYSATYDGLCMYYTDFRAIMDNIDI